MKTEKRRFLEFNINNNEKGRKLFFFFGQTLFLRHTGILYLIEDIAINIELTFNFSS